MSVYKISYHARSKLWWNWSNST